MIRLILLTDFTESFSFQLLKGILAYSNKQTPWVICRMPPAYKANYGIKGVVEWANSWKADAIIGRFDNEEDVSLFKKSSIIAIAQDYKSRFKSVPNITGNYYKTGRMAAEFLLSKGFKHFAFYGYQDTVWSKERCKGFYESIAEHGFKDSFYCYENQSIDDFWLYETSTLLNWLNSLPPSTAVMACDDNQANRMAEVCKANNIKVPNQIAIIGVDNDEMICNLSDPPLSSISHDVVRGGFEAAALIAKMKSGKQETYEDIVIEPVAIVNRLSTDFYSTTDSAIHKVLEYIHQNIAEKITVGNLLKETTLSRRLLEIRFKQVTKQTIHRYILNLKIERFAQLLLASNIPISEVAEQVGITNFKNLSRQFKIIKKVTPNEYRKEHQVLNHNDLSPN
ncbi:MAG: substrate-binding domain-containing protein [Phocaeicola sp.]